jgi:hypothetical protein
MAARSGFKWDAVANGAEIEAKDELFTDYMLDMEIEHFLHKDFVVPEGDT